jgi:ribokinase
MGLFDKRKEYDFVSIGDIVIDAFIKVKDASVNCDIDKANCKLCFRFGDKIPYESVEEISAVGNSPNAAVSAARLGLNTALITDVGDDTDGKKCEKVLVGEKIALDFVTSHKGLKTNYHYVLWYEEDRTILIKHTEFPYKLRNIGKPKWIYLSSLGENSLPYHLEIADFLMKNPEVKLAFQPGTFQMKFGHEKLSEIYKRTEVFFCNLEEAHRILGLPEGSKGVREVAELIRNLGPKIVMVTDGPKGAYAYTGDKLLYIKAYPDPKQPLDRTGAGDAFSSTFVAALALGKSPEEALAWGPINSMSVVQEVGAQKGLLTRDRLEKYLAEAPEEYKVEEK